MSTYKCTAILLAAGRGTRMGGGVRKQYLSICGKPLFLYSLETFEKSSVITDVVLVVPEGDEEYCRSLTDMGKNSDSKLRVITAGGAERYDSVYNGLKAIDWPCDYVFIHDGARPFIDEPSLVRLLENARECGACVAGMPSKDTIKLTDSENCVISTPDRKRCWIIQTPQVFERELIVRAYETAMAHLEEWKAQGISVTDDAMMVEQTDPGRRVRLVEATYRNIKVTTPEDLLIAQAFIENGN